MSKFIVKEALQKIRKNKQAKEENSPLFSDVVDHSAILQESNLTTSNNQQFQIRLKKLQNTVGQLSRQLQISNDTVNTLKRDNSELQTKVLKLQYQNSQLKLSSKQSGRDRQKKSSKSHLSIDREDSRKMEENKRLEDIRRVDSLKFNQEEDSLKQIYLPEVQETLEMIRKEPLQNILKRKQQNFRALKSQMKQSNTGNKYLKEFASLCKDYGKSLKKPILIMKLHAGDFD